MRIGLKLAVFMWLTRRNQVHPSQLEQDRQDSGCKRKKQRQSRQPKWHQDQNLKPAW